MSSYLELNTQLSSNQQALKEGVHQFAREVLRPVSTQLDKMNDPRDVIAPGSPLWMAFKAAYSQGFHTALIPTQAGGMGLAGLDLHIALEELGWGSAEFAAAIAVAGFPFAVVAGTGNAALIEELVAPFLKDKEARWVGCWAITEPDHGSDQFFGDFSQSHNPKTQGRVTARAEGDQLVINGEKAAWVSNGTIATHAITYLTLDSGAGQAGGGVAFIPLDLPGVSKGAPLDKMGQRALNQGSIIFKDVRIPKRYLLIDATVYAAVLQRTLTLANSAMGAIFTGVARAAYEEALAFCKSRVQGGKPICEHQLVQKHLFEMFTKVETCRALSRAAIIYCQDVDPMRVEYAIAAKTYCTQTCLEVTNTALQLFGSRGLTKDFYIEKLFRDARAALIEDGANDVLALVGARRILERETGK